MAKDFTKPRSSALPAGAEAPAASRPVTTPASAATDLESRQTRERNFHDLWAEEGEPSELDPIRRAFCVTTPETTYALKALGDLQGRRVLDVGCGSGETTVWFALQGAIVDAVDISPRMVEVSRGLAVRSGVG